MNNCENISSSWPYKHRYKHQHDIQYLYWSRYKLCKEDTNGCHIMENNFLNTYGEIKYCEYLVKTGHI